MAITITPRTLAAFTAGFAVALVAVFVFRAWNVDAGTAGNDATFVGMTPCRLVDTRPAPDRVGTAGTFSAEDTNTFAARGTNGECTIPNDAVALSLNITAIGATAPTFLTVWPGGTQPLASSLNPEPGQPPTPNAVTTQLSGSGSFKVYNLAGNVDVVIDVNGYHTKQTLAGLAGLAARVDTLEQSQPFVTTGYRDEYLLTNAISEAVVVSTDVTAPVDGHVTINSSTTANMEVACTITQGTTLGSVYRQFFSAGSSGQLGHSDTLSGTRRRPISAGQTVTYNLVCKEFGLSDVTLVGSTLTAIFTPAP